ncbi:hypothetical protein [Alkalihalobacillus sp. R86527]|uniref:hypothetical protein n=1 Tax=Alkalihalobacillus sp. R86527 TaxID=3093863 RepID=UPI00366AFDA3
MKKSIIGLGVIVCLAVCAYFVFTYNSEEKVALPDSTQVVDHESINREMSLITMEVMEGLKGNDVVGDITTDYQKSVTIQTSIKSSDKNADALKSDIEETVNEILKSEELKSVSKVDSYKVIVDFK